MKRPNCLLPTGCKLSSPALETNALCGDFTERMRFQPGLVCGRAIFLPLAIRCLIAKTGLERELKDARPFMFRDHGRFADLATSNHQALIRQRGSVSGGNQLSTNCVPSLVSFVGQTGAGKSSLIKLLVHFNQWIGQGESYPSPVPGITGRDLPTSEDVHLYADPLTAVSECPILFADSEGLDGGEREPLAASLRKTREKEEMESLGSESDYSATPRHFTEREVLWMDSKMKRTRQFAASQLYPRILFAFSDVVVFVHRNPR